MSRDSAIKERSDFWLKLDNAAKIFPAIMNREHTAVFRVAVVLKERIKANAFRQAINELENRFPYYKVKLRAGFFWYYFESNDIPFNLTADKGIPCRSFRKDELMFRILVKERMISVEFSHLLTDGTGALEFLKSILITYLAKCGLSIPEELTFLLPEDTPKKEEYEDAYTKYFKRIGSGKLKLARSFHLPFHLKQKPRFESLIATMPLDVILKKAKAHDASLNDYLVAVYLYSLQNIYDQQATFKKRRSHKRICVQVPVNLRRIYHHKTMRNFSLFVLPEIDLRLGHYSFEEIVKVVHYQMRLETDKKLISKIIARNVGAEKNIFIRPTPLFIKSLFLANQYKLTLKRYSGVLTNLGKIDLGPVVNEYVDKFLFIAPPPNPIVKVNCAAVGFNNKLVLTFGNITMKKELERQFLTFLTGEDIPVKLIKSNPYDV